MIFINMAYFVKNKTFRIFRRELFQRRTAKQDYFSKGKNAGRVGIQYVFLDNKKFYVFRRFMWQGEIVFSKFFVFD